MLARTSYNEVPPRVDYALTPLGRGLADAIIPLLHLGNQERGGDGRHLRGARQPGSGRKPKDRFDVTHLEQQEAAAGRERP